MQGCSDRRHHRREVRGSERVTHAVDGDATRAGDLGGCGDRVTDRQDRVLAASEEQGRNLKLRQPPQQVEIVRAQAGTRGDVTRQQGDPRRWRANRDFQNASSNGAREPWARRQLSSRILASGGVCASAASHVLDGGGRPEVGCVEHGERIGGELIEVVVHTARRCTGVAIVVANTGLPSSAQNSSGQYAELQPFPASSSTGSPWPRTSKAIWTSTRRANMASRPTMASMMSLPCRAAGLSGISDGCDSRPADSVKTRSVGIAVRIPGDGSNIAVW